MDGWHAAQLGPERALSCVGGPVLGGASSRMGRTALSWELRPANKLKSIWMDSTSRGGAGKRWGRLPVCTVEQRFELQW